MTRTDAPIRRAREDDAPAIAALIAAHAARGQLVPRTPEEVAIRTNDFLVVERGAELAGCVHLDEFSPSLAEIRSLATAEGADPALEARLVEAAEKLAVKREYTTIFTVTNDEDLFRKRGYEPREIPELRAQRSEISRFRGVFARDLGRGKTRGEKISK